MAAEAANGADGAASTEVEAEAALRRPASCGEMFLAFNRLALQGFGGVLPVAHRELVERQRWLSSAQFVELLTLGQVLPGPNIINIALIIGDRFFGWRGALTACFGLLTAPLFIVLALATMYQQFADNPLLVGALRGMVAMAAGLIVATAIKLARTLKTNPLGLPACIALGAATFVAVGLLRWPMVGVVLALGGVGMALAWRRLRQADSLAPPSAPPAPPTAPPPAPSTSP